MSLVALLLALLLGAIVGIASGLLGIGGGILMVPFLYLLMSEGGWSGLDVPLDYQATLAHATSLAVIVPTALSSLLAFHRKGVVVWAAIVPMGVTAVVTALLGTWVAVWLPTPYLKTIFGVFLVAMSIRLIRRGNAEGGEIPEERELRWWAVLAGGGMVGFLSALLGVGGGIVAIPVLIHWARMELHRVVPASIGIIVFAAPAGVISYALAGQGVAGLPWGSLGFVHLPSALAIIPGAVLMAPIGARWNQKMKAKTLRPLFGFLLLILGLELAIVNGGRLILGF